jgi:hypothetical protein
MKTIISGVLAAIVVAVCLTLNVEAKSLSPVVSTVPTIAVSDTGKMAGGKMKMEKKNMAKMEKSKMKMGKMKKDTSVKM